MNEDEVRENKDARVIRSILELLEAHRAERSFGDSSTYRLRASFSAN